MSAVEPVGLGRLARAGARGVQQYTGMVLALFLIQVLVSWGAGLIIWRILVAAYDQYPMFDDAVDGDLTSLLLVLRSSPGVLAAVGWVGFGAVLAWVVSSWFLAGGALTVLTERPRGRRETARCFGAGGAATFLVFFRLGLISLLLHLPVLIVLGLGVGHVVDKLEYALTVRELIVPLIVGLLPAALGHVLVSTIIDYARAELVLRRPTHESLGAIRVAVRAAGFVFRRPLALAHVGVYWLVFIALSLGFAWLGHGRAMLGTSGALALLALREGLALLRLALKVGVLAGQVDLTSIRPPPPRELTPAE